MREAIRAHLLADPAVAALAGARVYAREGPLGGLSLEATPEAFTADGDLLPSLVVLFGNRRALAPTSRDVLHAEQSFDVVALDREGFAAIRPLVRAVKRSLHRVALVPVTEPVGWADTRWTEESPDVIDPALGRPMRWARFAATITERLED